MTNVVVYDRTGTTLAYVMSRIESRVNRGIPVGEASMSTLATIDPVLYSEWIGTMADLHNRSISIDEVADLVLDHYSDPRTWTKLDKEAKKK